MQVLGQQRLGGGMLVGPWRECMMLVLRPAVRSLAVSAHTSHSQFSTKARHDSLHHMRSVCATQVRNTACMRPPSVTSGRHFGRSA